MIVDYTTGEQLCVGAFLTPNMVITAGTCLLNGNTRHHKENHVYAVHKYGVRNGTARNLYRVQARVVKRFLFYKYEFYINNVGFAVSRNPMAADRMYVQVEIPLDEYLYEKWVSDVVHEERTCQVPIVPQSPEKKVNEGIGWSPGFNASEKPLKTTGKIEMLPVKMIKYGECVANLKNEMNMTNSDMNMELLIGVGLVCAKSPDNSSEICKAKYGSPVICDSEDGKRLLGVISMHNCYSWAVVSVKMAFLSRADRVVRDFVSLSKEFELNGSTTFKANIVVKIIALICFTYTIK
ncbi:hypothetical protein GE061_002510 [Apolygus lucorum]|uniref:Uncharacterized protein n=1 Tax=Apolygus lucorum TaxID=248454 RepID=A0A6A4JER9_APOLU|nr:hypothetical protein GE061_002510 [Apolygus lucorum]